MLEIYIALIGAALLAASYTDLRTREVPDWLNYSLIAAGIGVRGLTSILEWDWMPIVKGILGLGAMYLLALLLFNTGQWGGGDSKLLMGIGAVLGLEFAWKQDLLLFLAATLFFGAIYGIVWSIWLMAKNFRPWKKEFIRLLKQRKYVVLRQVLLAVFFLGLLVIVFWANYTARLFIFLLMLLLGATLYLHIVIKAVEKTAMHKLVPPEKLTEGDWIVREIKVNGKYICGPKDLGISRTQIAKLVKLKKQKKIKLVLIKEGIPFVPSFLMAFIATIFASKVWMFLSAYLGV